MPAGEFLAAYAFRPAQRAMLRSCRRPKLGFREADAQELPLRVQLLSIDSIPLICIILSCGRGGAVKSTV